MNKVLTTAYLKSKNSTQETQDKSATIAKVFNTLHYEVNIDSIVESYLTAIKVFFVLFLISTQPIFKEEPKFKANGGNGTTDLALQNIQARSRMVLSYLIA